MSKGKNPSVEGQESPVEGEESGVSEEESLVEGEESPVEGLESLVERLESLVFGQEPLVSGQVEGKEGLVSGEDAPAQGEDAPAQGEDAPAQGEDAPSRPQAGSHSLKEGGESRADGEATSCPHLPKGQPVGLPDSNYFICRDPEREGHRIYALSANIESKFADFVAYCITPQTITGAGEQSRTWMADPDLPEDATLEPEDYRGANEALGTDRGHLAPLASFRGANWQPLPFRAPQTNYLGNIVPPKSVLNRGFGADIEERERDLTRKYGHLCAITGPLYQRNMANLPNADETHHVPSGYIFVLTYNGQTEAYLFDQNTPKGTDYRSGSTTVEQIEALTGADEP